MHRFFVGIRTNNHYKYNKKGWKSTGRVTVMEDGKLPLVSFGRLQHEVSADCNMKYRQIAISEKKKKAKGENLSIGDETRSQSQKIPDAHRGAL